MFSICKQSTSSQRCLAVVFWILSFSSIVSQGVRLGKTLKLLSRKFRLSNYFPSYSRSASCVKTHSPAIPPVVVKTNGVNVPCSISITLSAYCLCKSLHWGDTPEHGNVQISVSPKSLEHEYPNGHQGLCERHELMSP